MPRSLLSSRYKRFARENTKEKMLVSKAQRSSRIWDPLKREIGTRSSLKNSAHFVSRLQASERSLIQSKDWLTSDLIPFTVRYELEQRHNITLMEHYGDNDSNSEEIVTWSSDDDSDGENKFFESTPRKINFDDMDVEIEKNYECNVRADGLSKEKKNGPSSLALNNEKNKKFVCDVCQKSFDKLWAYNNHVPMHSGEKPYRCSYKTCTKQYADR
ncbi:Zinc finger protein [Pseudolycoriella hygida]|uniref:Zinc finger protein n=1 Tax=Pseudolycoriella hygida TaxID=35572 RepID=A0A9Q0S8X9_9DIPT|nr:Zinc finger protein [Pseudolycoriella hygida]